ncbi:MAG: UDP-N-acetylmuramoyl-tripeptide--D-alanyl-D-alanine ligase [Caldimonas sp.]|nr:MAG: UDP-N-acetylmuramoyl-tripeptide--D-alanyl-D-alanine ligase [Caldimonas sp.]
MMTLALAHSLLPGSTLVGDGQTRLLRVHTDTRSLQAGDLFVALRGQRFDAHEFLAQARAAGAAAAVAERGLNEAGLPGLLVRDTRAALGQLAAGWRARMQLPLIAVTGSNGKTTVTQMIASILRAWVGDAAALATQGNFNNDIGVPLTLLRLRQDDQTWHRVAVVELGMNHPGEIAQLARWAAPTVALVNNAQREHQEFMHGVEAVARENGAVIEALGPKGVAVFPAEDAYTELWRSLAGPRPVWVFGEQQQADVRGQAQWSDTGWMLQVDTPMGRFETQLHIAGRHNIHNALAATACALAAGAPLEAIAQGLQRFVPVRGRSQLQALVLDGAPLLLVDDSYNANPDSVRAAIDVLAELPAPRWLVLGDMGEVGDQGPAFHAEVGAYARERGIDMLWAVGAQSLHAARAHGAGAVHFASTADAVAALGQRPSGARSVLVKGSRFMKMEQMVQALQARAAAVPAEAGRFQGPTHVQGKDQPC